ncbi:MAG: ribonuclease HIII [Candidatus Zixiibacteriota bacterium]|nr:MAG: ribonuclease HIII [candidate division Zixibacteria bacterium]
MSPKRRVIGIDESGKGDFFGPLVIASFLADDAELGRLKSLGVKDGKLLSDSRLQDLDRALRQSYPHALVVISPESYNKKYDEIRNLNKLLAEGHAVAIDQLLAKHSADVAISDKFGKAELIESALSNQKHRIELEQIVRGESIAQVAAASILARARFIRELDKLSARFNRILPRGAAPAVDAAGRELVRDQGMKVLSVVAKLHFKNYRRIINPDLFTR